MISNIMFRFVKKKMHVFGDIKCKIYRNYPCCISFLFQENIVLKNQLKFEEGNRTDYGMSSVVLPERCGNIRLISSFPSCNKIDTCAIRFVSVSRVPVKSNYRT